MILVLHPERSVHELFASESECCAFDPKEFNRVAERVRHRYSAYIDRLNVQQTDNIDWWVTSLASRNTIAGTAFLNVSYLFYAAELIQAGTITRIICQSKGLKEALELLIRDFGQHVPVVRYEGVVNRVRRSLVANILRSLRFAWSSVERRIAAARTARKAVKTSFSSPINLIDVFVGESSFANGEFRDRYYGSLAKLTPEMEWVYLPFLYNIGSARRIFNLMRNANVSFVIKEDYLRLSDYLWALGHLFRRRRIKIESERFDGLDVSAILREELNCQSTTNAMLALLEYRLPRRLKESGIDVQLLLDWFENQDIDKGLNAGFSRYSPATRRIGYQGFVVTPFYLCAYPTEQELKAGVIPQQVAVIGSELVAPAAAQCTDLAVVVAPAFRFSGLWDSVERKSHAGTCSILVVLPIMADEVRCLLSVLRPALENLRTAIPVSVKPHPTMSGETVDKLLSSIRGKVRVVGGDFNACLAAADFVISSGTSSGCLETVAHGMPVIITGSLTGITHNPIPLDVTQDLWRVCYSWRELVEGIESFAAMGSEKRARCEAAGRLVRVRYFSPVNDESVSRFLVTLRGTDAQLTRSE
jgi:hypothetical protein